MVQTQHESLSPSTLEPIVECVPNFSEGRDERVVREIVRSMEVFGVSLLDWSMDRHHNRSVVTIAGSPEAVAESAIRGVGRASQLIDLTKQDGVHPRIGAADVVPFVPVANYSMGQTSALAHHAGLEIWRRFGVPVYFYEAAAMRPDRMRLEDVRRGQFEGLREALRSDSSRMPDVGQGELHPTAGAAAVGARQFLIAYNIYLNSADLHAARTIAKELRASSGGFVGVKAMGVMVDGRAQVSFNITDFQATPVATLHAACCRIAANMGIQAAEGELIGLVPAAACAPTNEGETLPEWLRQTSGFHPDEKILERRLKQPMKWPEPLAATHV